MFRFSEISPFGLPELNKIDLAYNIFVPIPVQGLVYLKAFKKIAPMDVSVSRTIDQKLYLKI